VLVSPEGFVEVVSRRIRPWEQPTGWRSREAVVGLFVVASTNVHEVVSRVGSGRMSGWESTRGLHRVC
jgi:hypothetical protein